MEVTSATRVQLSWLPPDPQLWNGVITNYTVVYELLGPVGMTSDNSSHTVMTKTIPTQDSPLANNADPRDVSFPLHWERVAIEGLYEHHVYKFSVFIANAVGRSGMTMTIIQGLPGAGRVVMTLHTFPGSCKVFCACKCLYHLWYRSMCLKCIYLNPKPTTAIQKLPKVMGFSSL